MIGGIAIKNKIIKSTLLLILFGIAAKILSMVVKIITTRMMGIQSMSVFAIVAPLMVLVITLSQQGIPMSVSKLIAANPEKRKKIIITAYAIGLTTSFIILALLTIFSDFIAIKIFHNAATTKTIIATGILAPLIVLSSFYKGYLIGMEKISITSASQIFEEIGRLAFILLFASYFTKLGSDWGAFGVMIGICVGECFQMLSLLFLHYRKIKIPTKNILISTNLVDKTYLKGIYSSSIPLTVSRMISSLAYSLEPVILTNLLLKANFSSEYITLNYGILQTYALPILFLPGFFATAFSTVLLPNMTKLIAKKEYEKGKNFFYKVLLISFIVAIVSSTVIFFCAPLFLKIMYNTTDGLDYIKILAFPCILYYIEAPLSTAMHTLSLEKNSLLISIFSSTIRILMMFILIPKMEVLGVEIAMITAVCIIIIYDFIMINKKLKSLNRKSIIQNKA